MKGEEVNIAIQTFMMMMMMRYIEDDAFDTKL